MLAKPSYLLRAQLSSFPVLPRQLIWFVTWEGRLWAVKTANCTSSAVCGDPSSFPRRMTFPWEVSSWLWVVSNPNLCHSPVGPLSLFWAHPKEEAPETI